MSIPATGTHDALLVKPRNKFEGHTHWVYDIIHLPGGQQIMTCSEDSSLRSWNLQTGKQFATWQNGKSGMSAIALSPDGKKVVSGSRDGAVRLWNSETGNVIAKWMGHTGTINSVCWNQDAGRVVSGSSYDGTARVWDVESGKTILEIKTSPSRFWVGAAIYSPDATMIATSGHESKKEFIKIWDVNTGKLVTNLKGHTWIVACLAWSADGRKLFSGSFDHSIRTWDTTTWKQIAVFTGHTSSVHGIAISPNGRILASASVDKTARLWNLDNGQPIGLPLQHANYVNCVSFSTDGKLLATACEDRNAYTWDISVIARETGLDELVLGPNDAGSANAPPPLSQRRENARRLHLGFFDNSPHHHTDPSIGHSISSLASSSRIHSHPLLGRFSSLFHRSHPITDQSMEHKQSLRRGVLSRPGPSAVDVAPRQECISDQAKPSRNPTWWTRCIFFLCCASVADTNGHRKMPSGS